MSERPAIVAPDGTLTYPALDLASRRVAAALLGGRDDLEQAPHLARLRPQRVVRGHVREERVATARLREREVDSRIQIADSEVDNFLNTLQQQESRSEEFNLSHILIRVPEQASPEQLQDRRKRAEAALAQIKNGADFRQIAAGVSDAPDAVQGGLMGWREFVQLPTLFGDGVKALKPGEVTPVLRSAAGFHIIRVNDRRGHVESAMVTQTRARHILIKTSELV